MSFAYYYKPNTRVDYHLQQPPYYYSNQTMSRVQLARPANLNQQFSFNPINKNPVYGLSHTMSKVPNIPSTIDCSSTAFDFFF